MKYSTVSDEDLRAIRMGRLRELEVNHYQFTLEEEEEPGRSAQRLHSLADMERRIQDHRRVLGLDAAEGVECENDENQVAGS